MSGVSPCPNDGELQSFVLGGRSSEDVDTLARHIEQCTRCAETTEQLLAADTLAEPLKKADPPADVRDKVVVESLIEKLSALPAISSDTYLRTSDSTPSTEEESGEEIDLLAPPEADDELGRLASYRVLRLLGQGGMGIVFHAEDIQLRRPVALKVMRPSLAASGVARQRFSREAQAAAAVVHDHIVSIYQVGEDRGAPFLAMPLLQGESLEDRLRRVDKLSATQALRIGRETAEGLAAAHVRGLIHRDIKPANIFLEAGSDRVKIVDFGLARAAGDDARLTHTGAIMGTPAYMSPEQARGQAVDGRSDLFSLGCVLYRACTGVVPFKGPDVVSTLTALALTSPVSPRKICPDLPQPLSDLIERLLSKNPEQRPASARDVADAIAGIEREQAASGIAPVVGRPATASRPQPDSQTAAESRRRRLGILVATALLIVGGGLLAWQIIIRIRDKEGNEIAIETNAKKGSTVIVESDGKEIARVTSRTAPRETGPAPVTPPTFKPAVVKIVPDRLPEIVPGAALSPLALVAAPAAIKGVQSWTVETKGGRGAIRSLVYSGDGRRVAASSHDGTIRIFEPRTGRLVAALVNPLASAGVLAWSPDGQTIACGSDKTVQLWDVETGRLIRSQTEHAGSITAIAWSPNGTNLATGANDSAVRLWNVEDGRLLDTLQLHKAPVSALVWSPHGKMLASASHDKTVRLWEAESGNHLKTLESHAGAVQAVAWSADGTLIASAGDDATVQIWSANSGTQHGAHNVGQPVRSLLWLADGKTAAVGYANGVAGILDVESGQMLRQVQGQAGDGAEVAWAHDGRTVAFGSVDGAVRIWEVRTGKLLAHVRGHKVRGPTWNYSMPPLAWSPDGKMIAYATLDSHVLLWDVGSKGLLRSFPVAHVGPIVSLAWSPNSKLLASGGSDNTIWIWNAESGENLLACTHAGWISALALSPDGNTIASGGQDSTARLWEAATGRQLHKLEGHTTGVQALAWSPDSKRLISGSYDQTLRIWDAESGTQLRLLDRDVNDRPLGENRAAAWSPDGKKIAAGGVGMWIWDAESGKILHKFQEGGFRNIAWARDGKTLAAGFGGGMARTWEAETGKLLRTLTGHSGNVDAVTWAPDGKVLGCASANFWTIDQIRLWDTDSGRSIATLVTLANPKGLAVTAAGHVRGTPGIEGEVVYVVQTDAGLETLTVEEFSGKYGWQNDPDRLHFTAE
jgi:WD40 repeat protein/serine/threonine protein kinase